MKTEQNYLLPVEYDEYDDNGDEDDDDELKKKQE